MGSGGTPLSSVPAYYGGGIPWVSIADMTQAGKVIVVTEKTLTPLGLANSAAQMFPTGTVLYAMYASLGECGIAGISSCTSQAILGIRPTDRLDNEFLYYFLASIKGRVKTLGFDRAPPRACVVGQAPRRAVGPQKCRRGPPARDVYSNVFSFISIVPYKFE
jgi:hypothetical protein